MSPAQLQKNVITIKDSDYSGKTIRMKPHRLTVINVTGRASLCHSVSILLSQYHPSCHRSSSHFTTQLPPTTFLFRSILFVSLFVSFQDTQTQHSIYQQVVVDTIFVSFLIINICHCHNYRSKHNPNTPAAIKYSHHAECLPDEKVYS
jgi:hypothetical protein